jgi:5-oxoprolinase (ATP-hydrolysing)
VLIHDTQLIIKQPDCRATITEHGDISIAVGKQGPKKVGTELDSIQLSVFSNRFMSIAEQMGKTLQVTTLNHKIIHTTLENCHFNKYQRAP